MNSTENTDILCKNAEYMQNLGISMKELNPSISKYFMYKNLLYIKQVKAKKGIINENEKCVHCPACGNPLLPGDYKVRIHSRPVITKKIKKLIKKYQTQSWKINEKERKKLISFKKCHNKIVYRCLNCNNCIEYAGSRFPKIPNIATPVSKVLFNPKWKKIKQTSINDSFLSSSNCSRTPNSISSSLKETQHNKVFSKQNILEISSDISYNVKSSEKSLLNNSRYDSVFASPALKSNISSSTPNSKKKNKSLLQQMLENEQRRQSMTNNSLSSFLSSL